MQTRSSTMMLRSSKRENYFQDDDNNIDRLREIKPAVIDREVSDKQLKGDKHARAQGFDA